ncbi:MAG: PAQR family membrane homeostasis protein TrhA [Methanococcaceae archaeon]
MKYDLREPFSGLTHLGAAVAASAGLILLLSGSNYSPSYEIALIIYGFSLILMFSASAAYHLINAEAKVILQLRKVDHSAIFLLIAGTYTPICIRYFEGTWQWAVLITVWSIAFIGIIAKIFFINAPRHLSTGIYLLMGWISLMAIKQILQNIPLVSLIWFFLGGFFFTAGAVIYAIKKPDPVPGIFGFHELWHIFVILGCLCHFVLIARI